MIIDPRNWIKPKFLFGTLVTFRKDIWRKAEKSKGTFAFQLKVFSKRLADFVSTVKTISSSTAMES
jgi:cobalamin biosynthesis protein CobD/CbiB